VPGLSTALPFCLYEIILYFVSNKNTLDNYLSKIILLTTGEFSLGKGVVLFINKQGLFLIGNLV
jgi:hypothetical protein